LPLWDGDAATNISCFPVFLLSCFPVFLFSRSPYNPPMLQGTYTALITPFKDGQVDFERLDANVKFQCEAGLEGVVPVGTTGESPTLSHDEHRKVIEQVVTSAKTHSAGKAKVIAGTGSNSTAEALSLTQHARDVGADAALMVNPYYNKPSQEGLYRHFMTVADAVDLPICLYNIPGRTNVTMSRDLPSTRTSSPSRRRPGNSTSPARSSAWPTSA